MDPAYQMAMANYEQASQQGGPPQPQQGPQPSAGGKSLFTLADGSTVDDQYVAQLAAQHLGMPVQGVTPDGSGLQLQNGQVVPIMQALQQMGAQVQSFKPLQADYSQAQPMLRAALATLPDDFRRKQYLQHHMQSLGMAQPMIEGSGDDWFVYNPEAQTWMGATNAPGLDKTDAAGALISGTKMAGAIGGSMLGAAAGPAGMIGGAAAGGAGVNALQKAGFEMFDPSYADTRSQMGEGEVLGDIGKGAAVDAVSTGVPMVGGALLGRALGAGGQVAMAPLSRAAQIGGSMAEGAGQVGNRIAQAVDNPLGRDVVAAMMPGASQLQMLGLGAQLPAMAVRGGVRAAGHVGDSAIGRAALGEEAAQGLSNFSNRLLHPGSTRGAISELGGAAGRGIGRRLPVTPEHAAPYADEAKVWASNLLDIGSEEQIAHELARDAAGSAGGGWGRNAGSRIGEVVQAVEQGGKAADQLAHGMAGVAIKGARYGAAGLEHAGSAARRLGELGRGSGRFSLEDQLWGHLGAEEAYSRLPHANLDDADVYERNRRARQSYLAGGY